MAKRANVEKYAEFINEGDVLHEQYKTYEAQFVHRAHEELYALLAEILKFANYVLRMNDSAEIIKAVRRKLKDEYGIKTTTKTDEIGVLLRLVLRGAHRKTLFTYGRVIKQARSNNISAEGLANYIKENGGIEKLRTGEAEQHSSANYRQEIDDKRIMASYYLLACDEKRKLATVDIDENAYRLYCDSKNNDGFVFAACSYYNGKLNLLDFVEVDKELNEKLLLKLYSDAFNKARFGKEREALARRAFELEEMQAIMFGGQIVSSEKNIEEAEAVEL